MPRVIRLGALIAHSQAMRALLAEVRHYASADANVLISGETGVGKDLIAHALHEQGPRASHPFVKIDCSTLPPALVESELFGHERGAFTDATTAKAGRFELAGRGTIYLDGLNELGLDVQGKLLRLVEEKRFERLGGIGSHPVRARIVASAGAAFEDTVRAGAFREDLYHRLHVLPLHVLPLRERRDDIVPLARLFLRQSARHLGRHAPRLTEEAGRRLQAYAWPGNARELRHVIERTLLDMEAGARAVGTQELPVDVLEDADALFGTATTGRPTLDGLERRYIEIVLRETRGHQTRAAAVLGISRKSLWEKRRKHGLR